MADHSVSLITDQDEASIAATITGTGYIEALVLVYVTLTSGTLTLDIAVQGSATNATSGVGTYVTTDSFTQITATGNAFKRISNFGKYLRLLYTIGGSTPVGTITSYIILKT